MFTSHIIMLTLTYLSVSVSRPSIWVETRLDLPATVMHYQLPCARRKSFEDPTSSIPYHQTHRGEKKREEERREERRRTAGISSNCLGMVWPCASFCLHVWIVGKILEFLKREKGIFLDFDFVGSGRRRL